MDNSNLRTIHKTLINNSKFKIVKNLEESNHKWYIIIDERHIIGYDKHLESRSDIVFELSELIDFRTIQVATKAEVKRFFSFRKRENKYSYCFDPDWYVGG